MFSESPELYDLIYGSFKDYVSESRRIAELLSTLSPDAHSVLDIACGTGEHARHLQTAHGYAVDGLDLEPGLIGRARAKLPSSDFSVADMSDFSLDRRYDVVLCLFSAIGYLGDLERVAAAFRCFRDHLTPGGVAVVEPWYEPDAWHPGRVYLHTAESEGIQVARMSRSRTEGRTSILDFHYLVGNGDGIEHRHETHRLGLFTREELSACFEGAGFERLEYDAEGLTGRGLYVARRGSGDAAPPGPDQVGGQSR